MLKWGKAQLSARDRSSVERLTDVVSSLLDHIRFPHMSQEEQVEAVQSGCVCVCGGRAILFLPAVCVSVLPAKLSNEIVLANANRFDVRSLSVMLVALSPHSHLCQEMEDTPRKRRRLGGAYNM